TLGAIDRGILALVCAEPGDDESIAERMLERLLGYRVFSDGAGKMNLSVEDVRGGLLLVPQFTLAADTSKGMRPSFSSALAPDAGLAQAEGLGYAVCAPFPYLAQVSQALSGSRIAWGAQNVSEHDSGAYTGEVSGAMLKEFGCRFAIVGHSERRGLYAEGDG